MRKRAKRNEIIKSTHEITDIPTNHTPSVAATNESFSFENLIMSERIKKIEATMLSVIAKNRVYRVVLLKGWAPLDG